CPHRSRSRRLLSARRAPSAISTRSLHDALPISRVLARARAAADLDHRRGPGRVRLVDPQGEGTGEEHVRPRSAVVDVLAADDVRSEEHTSELQSRFDLVCRLLLEKKKTPEIRRR